MISRLWFIFDVESIGLHGEGFAVAGVTISTHGNVLGELSHFKFACPRQACNGDVNGRKWVDENVPEIATTHGYPEGIRKAFWKEWLSSKKLGAEMAVECGWPVEANFLRKCVVDEPVDRGGDGPYPLHEIASYMAAAGMDPMKTYDRLPNEWPAHDPLADARLSARLLAEAISRLTNP